MQFQNRFTSGCLMQTVDVLGDHCTHLALLLQFSQCLVCCIRLRIREQHFVFKTLPGSSGKNCG